MTIKKSLTVAAKDIRRKTGVTLPIAKAVARYAARKIDSMSLCDTVNRLRPSPVTTITVRHSTCAAGTCDTWDLILHGPKGKLDLR